MTVAFSSNKPCEGRADPEHGLFFNWRGNSTHSSQPFPRQHTGPEQKRRWVAAFLFQLMWAASGQRPGRQYIHVERRGLTQRKTPVTGRRDHSRVIGAQGERRDVDRELPLAQEALS